jgi:hypothetical protein
MVYNDCTLFKNLTEPHGRIWNIAESSGI